jgi:transcription antitermination factor NusG
VLQRLAEYNKVTTTASTVKNSKCFVFQTVETSEAFVKDNNNKRKAAEGTPNVVKKLRLDDLSPAPGKKPSDKSRRAKKLFGNW